MSRLTPSTAFTIRFERPNHPAPPAGKWTFKSLIEINALLLVVITHSRFQRKPRQRNDRANDDRESALRTAEIHACISLQLVHNAAQTDNPRADARDREVVPESDKACHVQPLDPEPNAATLACRDCRAAERVQRLALVRKSFRRTSRSRDRSSPRRRRDHA